MEDSLFVFDNMALHNHLDNRSRQFLPLDIHPTETTASAIKFPANMGATIGFPFTDAQWIELKRQAMIYKYMMASVPVPPHLLISSDSAFHTPSSLLGVNPRFGTNGRDQQPGRCRRTDGKKWRCSRDAAPDQKYCERHMHRGRPRSRKPVERLHANNTIATCHINKKTRHNPFLSADSLATLPVSDFNVNKNGSFPLSLDESDNKIASADVNVDCVSAYKEPRRLEWMKMKGDPVSVSTGEQRQSLHTEVGLATDSCFNSSHVLDQQRYHDELMNLNLFANLGAGEYQQGNMGIMFKNGSPSYTSHADGEMGGLRMSLGMIKSEEKQEQTNIDSDSWAAATTPGGPLAEVLQNGTNSAQSVSAPANGDFADSPIITASSPDEIVQTSLVLFSESSGNCSLKTVAI